MKSVKGTYKIFVEGFDWGCGVTKAILTLDHAITEFHAQDLRVTETKQVTDFSKAGHPVIVDTLARTLTDAYVSNEKGERISGSSRHITLELSVDQTTGSPLIFTVATQLNTWSDPYTLQITLTENARMKADDDVVGELTIDEMPEGRITAADPFAFGRYAARDGITYDYAYWSPGKASQTLVVWLHGMGEGGTERTDPYVTLLANKVTALIGDEFQSMMGGAQILVPQCPTYWMDADGQGGNFNGGVIMADGTSYYTSSLHELIEYHKTGMHADKVILAGCSNGGYMCLVMAKTYADEYAAYVPVCEAMPDLCLTQKDIETLASVPMYFIYCRDDDIVNPHRHEVPTIRRMREAGAKDLHVSTTGRVTDETGTYTYSSHWSWIYFHKNACVCDEHGERVWEWMASKAQ